MPNAPIVAVPAIDPNDPRRLVCGGEQLFLAGYYPGLQPLISGPSAFDGFYRRWFDLMAQNGVNLIRHCLTFGMTLDNAPWRHPYNRPGPGTICTPQNAAGWHSGPKVDLDSFDESFFAYWDEVLEYAAERGIVVIATVFDSVHTHAFCTVNCQPQAVGSCGACNAAGEARVWQPFQLMGLYYDYYYGETNINGVSFGQPCEWYSSPAVRTRQKAYAAYAASRLGRHPNLIWEVTNELNTSCAAAAEWQDDLGRTIRAADPLGHLLMPFDLPGHQQVPGQMLPSGSVAGSGAATVCQTYPPPYEHLEATTVGGEVSDYVSFRADLGEAFAAQAKNGKPRPLLSDNDFSPCPGDPNCTALYQRRKAWTAFSAGAYVNIFLFDVVNGEKTGIDRTVNSGIAFVGLLRALIAEYRLELSSSRAFPASLGASAQQPVWALGCRRQGGSPAVVVYFLQGGGADLGPLGLPDVAIGFWWNPQTGQLYGQATFTSGQVEAPPERGVGNKSASDPCAENDWLLVLTP